MPSPARFAAFKDCAATHAGVRAKYALNDVRYDDRMTDAEVRGLHRYLKDKIKGASKHIDNVLVYNVLKKLSDQVLCRFPRPSELNRLAKLMGHTRGLRGVRRTVTLRGSGLGFGAFVGPLGQNFARLTKDLDLLYLWLDKGDDRDTRKLHMFSVSSDQDSMDAVLEAAEQRGLEVVGGVHQRSIDLGKDDDLPDMNGGAAGRSKTRVPPKKKVVASPKKKAPPKKKVVATRVISPKKRTHL